MTTVRPRARCPVFVRVLEYRQKKWSVVKINLDTVFLSQPASILTEKKGNVFFCRSGNRVAVGAQWPRVVINLFGVLFLHGEELEL